MKRWSIEFITESCTVNCLEIEANEVLKVNYHRLIVDGVSWDAPESLRMSFAEIKQIDNVVVNKTNNIVVKLKDKDVIVLNKEQVRKLKDVTAGKWYLFVEENLDWIGGYRYRFLRKKNGKTLNCFSSTQELDAHKKSLDDFVKESKNNINNSI